MKNLQLLPYIFFSIVIVACTYTISLVHTEGVASDVVDETSTPTSNISPTIDHL